MPLEGLENLAADRWAARNKNSALLLPDGALPDAKGTIGKFAVPLPDGDPQRFSGRNIVGQ